MLRDKRLASAVMLTLLLLVIPSLITQCFAGLDDTEELLDGKIEYNDQIINSLPKMPSTTAKPETGKLQIGIKKKAENCNRKAQKGDTLHMHYRGTLKTNGVEFDNSYKRGTVLNFVLGSGQVIKGWDQGLLGICAGEKRKLIIPPHLAYGEMGSPPLIPASSTLVFEVEAVKVEAPSESASSKFDL